MLPNDILSCLPSIFSSLIQNVDHKRTRHIPNFQINLKKSNSIFLIFFLILPFFEKFTAKKEYFVKKIYLKNDLRYQLPHIAY